MKKILSITLLLTFLYAYVMAPVYAINDKNDKYIKKQQEQTENISGNINYDWWLKFNDDNLNEYILKAMQNNHDIKTAQLKLEQAKINIMAVRSKQFPMLAIGSAPAIAKLPNTTKTMGSIALPVYMSYELDVFGKNWDKTNSSKKLLKGVEYQTKALQISIAALVGSIYYNIVKLDKIIELQESISKDRDEVYRLMNLSYNEGIASIQDTIQAEKASILAKNDLIEYKKARNNALNVLAVLIGDSPNNIEEYKRIDYDNLVSKFNVPDEISSDIITNRPDYKSLESQLEAAGIDVRVAKKEFLPTIDILGAVAFIATSTATVMDWKSAVSLLGANASLPLFTGFAKVANLKLNKNKYAQILEQYQKTNLVAMQEINDSLYNFKSDNEKFKNNIIAFDAQNKDFNLANIKYKEGVISKLNLLQQRESLLFMEQLMINSKIACYIDNIELYKSTGAQI